MRLRNILPLVALLALPAMAQERAVMGGFQVGITKPTGGSEIFVSTPSLSVNDLVDGKIGFNVGGHVSFNLQNGHMIRIRLEETLYSGDFSSKIPVSGHSDIATVGVMGDYLYHVSGKNDGFYLTAGLGFEATAVKADFGSGEDTSSKAAFAWNAGLGWQFTPHVGLEARYASSHPTGLDYLGNSYDVKNDRWVLAVNFSF